MCSVFQLRKARGRGTVLRGCLPGCEVGLMSTRHLRRVRQFSRSLRIVLAVLGCEGSGSKLEGCIGRGGGFFRGISRRADRTVGTFLGVGRVPNRARGRRRVVGVYRTVRRVCSSNMESKVGQKVRRKESSLLGRGMGEGLRGRGSLRRVTSRLRRSIGIVQGVVGRMR